MQCPIDNVNLVMAERQGIEIDFCPKCRGVWLDRGELDKIIERVAAEAPAARQPAAPSPAAPQAHSGHAYAPPEHAPHYGQHGKPYYKKRKSMLSELFDFD